MTNVNKTQPLIPGIGPAISDWWSLIRPSLSLKNVYKSTKTLQLFTRIFTRTTNTQY
jgi:hypothetical protein